MPSKTKKSKGKARRKANGGAAAAKKEAKEGAPDAQIMQQLKIDDDEADEDTFLEEAIKLAAAEKEALKAAEKEEKKAFKRTITLNNNNCMHGFDTHGDPEKARRVVEFCEEYLDAFYSTTGSTVLAVGIKTANELTGEKFDDVWYNLPEMELVVSCFVTCATDEYLKGEIMSARVRAAIANYFESIVCFMLQTKNKNIADTTKMTELTIADEHTLVKYLRKHISCECLDEKYKQVKSITKMGSCANQLCSNRRVERKSMLYCTRCRIVNYCSSACQNVDWPKHKEHCGKRIYDYGK